MKKTKSHSIKLIEMKMDIDKAMNQTKFLMSDIQDDIPWVAVIP